MSSPSTTVGASRHAPVRARARLVAAVLLPAAAVLVGVVPLVSGAARAVAWAAVAVVASVVAARALRVALVVDADGVEVRNVRRTIRMASAEVESILERPVGPGPLRSVAFRGRVGTVSATVTAGGSRRELAPLFLILRRWSTAVGIDNRLERLEFLDRRTRFRLLESGDDVAVPCHLRRMSSRGWGPWAKGWLRLQPPGSGSPLWRADDPAAVALVQAHGERPVWLEDATSVEPRPVRYKAEAFHGDAADIIVYTTGRTVLEVACSSREQPLVLSRLRIAAGLDGGPP